MNRRICAAYFSATGTTERTVTAIADRLTEAVGAPAVRFEFTLPMSRERPLVFRSSDLVVFGVPVYAGRVPNVLLPFLRMVEGGGALAVPVVSYGNRDFDDGLIELRDLLEQGGFRTIAAGAFIGEHSFSRVLAAGRPDAADLETARRFADRLIEKLEGNSAPVHPVQVGGQVPYRPYYVPKDRNGSPVDIRKDKPKTSDACNDCKLCAEVCPMGSISHDDVREFTGICIKCGACVKKCPQNAKYYDSANYLYHKEELELQFSRRAEPQVFL